MKPQQFQPLFILSPSPVRRTGCTPEPRQKKCQFAWGKQSCQLSQSLTVWLLSRMMAHFTLSLRKVVTTSRRYLSLPSKRDPGMAHNDKLTKVHLKLSQRAMKSVMTSLNRRKITVPVGWTPSQPANIYQTSISVLCQVLTTQRWTRYSSCSQVTQI